MTIIDYLSTIIGDFPQLAFLKYIIAAVLLLIVFDAIISLFFGSLYSLFRGR